MERYSVVLLVGFLAAGAAAVAGAAPAAGGCDASALAASVAASCAAGAATPLCCEPVTTSVELGGGACLCRVASEMAVHHAGLDGSALRELYADCGGARRLAACGHGPEHYSVLPSAVVARPQLVGAAAESLDAPTCGTPSALAAPTREIRVVRLPAKHKKILIALATCQMNQVLAAFGYVAYKVYQRFHARS